MAQRKIHQTGVIHLGEQQTGWRCYMVLKYFKRCHYEEVVGSRQVVTGFNHSEEDLSQRKRYLVAKIIKDSNSWPTEAVGYARQIPVCLS